LIIEIVDRRNLLDRDVPIFLGDGAGPNGSKLEEMAPGKRLALFDNEDAPKWQGFEVKRHWLDCLSLFMIISGLCFFTFP
jgi:hypothetical protein